MAEARVITDPEERREILEAAADIDPDLVLDNERPVTSTEGRRSTIVPETPKETPISDEVKKEPRLRRFAKGFYNVVLNPMLPMGKSKVGYGVGVAAGMIANASHFAGMGVPARLALTAATFGSSLYLERWNRNKIKNAKSESEIADIEKKYLRANKFIRGISAGVAATSVVNLIGPGIAEVMDSEVWQKIGSSAKEYIGNMEMFQNFSVHYGVGEGAGNFSGLLKQFGHNTVESSSAVADNAARTFEAHVPLGSGEIAGSITVPESVVTGYENVSGAVEETSKIFSEIPAEQMPTGSVPIYHAEIPVTDSAGGSISFQPNERFVQLQEMVQRRFPGLYEKLSDSFDVQALNAPVSEMTIPGENTLEHLSWTQERALDPFLQPETIDRTVSFSAGSVEMSTSIPIEIKPGMPFEQVLQDAGVSPDAFFNNREAMAQTVFANEHTLRQFNPGAVLEFGEITAQGSNAPLNRLSNLCKEILTTNKQARVLTIFVGLGLLLGKGTGKKKK